MNQNAWKNPERGIGRITGICFCLAALWTAEVGYAQAAPLDYSISNLVLDGAIDGENALFTLAFEAETASRGARIPLAAGAIAYRGGALPRGATLDYAGNCYRLMPKGRGRHKVQFEFAGRPVREGDWRSVSFDIPMASVREVAVQCDRDDLEVNFPGALKLQRRETADGKALVTAFLGVGNRFIMRWKPAIKKLAAERVVECEANIIAVAGVGALHLDTILNYHLVQGSLNKLEIILPANVNITQVRGTDIQDWSIDRRQADQPLLTVSLTRDQTSQYLLQINGEMALPAFPCKFDLPALTPRDVIRANGFLTVGTDSAIKLLVNQSLSLTQVDQAAFPTVKLPTATEAERMLPQRRPFTYQFAGMPFTLGLAADDIVTAIGADDRLVLSVADNDVVLQAAVELDVRDAPTREAAFLTDPAWNVAGVTGAEIADYDVRDEADRRLIRVYFRNAVQGRTLVDLRLEHALADGAAGFTTPKFSVRGAKTERGYLVMSGEKGLRLKAGDISGLIEVHTGSTPMRVPDAQMAFRFKDAAWQAAIVLERTCPVVHSEIFHLLALGDGVLYGSALITYHIGGAPTREFKLTVPEGYQNVEFTGGDVRGWAHSNSVWSVALQEKIMGDYTLLAAYDCPVNYAGGEIAMGGVQTLETESEVGYIVAASSASLKLAEQARDQSLIPIDRDELPEAYALLVKDPFLASYKYVKQPHVVRFAATRYETETLLSQVADHVSLQTELSHDGETLSTATYFVKNASGQYLALNLPAGARLWSTKLIEPGGRRLELSALQGSDGLLVPIPRHSNLNTPVQIELVYAQNHGRPGWLRNRIRLEAPALQQAPAPFTRWSIRLPKNLAAHNAAGNAVRDRPAPPNGLGTVLASVIQTCRALLRSAPIGIWLILAAALAGGWLAAWHTRRVWPTIIVLAVGLTVTILSPAYIKHCPRIGAAAAAAWLGALQNPQAIGFSRNLCLPGDQPLFIECRLAPAWLGSAGNLWVLLGAGLAGAALLCIRPRAPSRRALSGALGWTLAATALAQLSFGRVLLSAAILVLLPAAGVWSLIRAGLQTGRRRRARQTWENGNDLPPFDPTPKSTPAPADGAAGMIYPPLLGAILAAGISFAALAVCAAPAANSAAPSLPAIPQLSIHAIDATITMSDAGRDMEKNALVVMQADCQAAGAATGLILSADCVLTAFETDSPRHMTISGSPAGYLLQVRREGTYRAKLTFQAPIRESNGQWSITLNLPPRLKNRVVLQMAESGLEVKSDTAVYCKALTNAPRTEIEALFGPDGPLSFTWRPQMRKIEQEQTMFFCEVNSLFTFEPGVVNGAHLARYQIAQGEIKTLVLTVPEPMNVTAVAGPGISTWRFDPAARCLEAILQTPASGAFALRIATQTPYEGLPYQAAVGAPQVQGAARQRGALALAAPDTVQILVEPQARLNAMNISDFAPDVAAAQGDPARSPIRRAFRYQQLPVGAAVKVEQVLPEIRVEEKASLSVADERIVLATQLKITVAKSGIFSLRLATPAGFDLESLTGGDITHWDEIKDGDRGIVVYFSKPVLGVRDLNLVLVRMEKGIADTITAPRVECVGAIKHSGAMVVSGERGVRLTTIRREGVSEVNPREMGIEQQGVLAFSLLRPEWLIVLKAEVLTPVIKPEVLQRVDLSEGMLQGRTYIRYRIENAGCKVFYLRAPQTNTLLSVSGADIAKVQVSDPAKGIWQVTLHNKVENTYTLVAVYQIPFDPGAGEVVLTPLLPVNTDTPGGYLTVMSDGRVQIKPSAALPGLKPEEARGIPATFGAGELSDAIFCYRTIQPDYVLPLSVFRHESAAVLPARVTETRLTSLMSEDGKMLTQVVMQMNVGDLRFLTVKLPQPEARIWSAFVNGKVAAPSREDGRYRIPLEAVEAGEPAAVEFLYASAAAGRRFAQQLDGPQMDLPLSAIRWNIHVLPNRFYFWPGGTLEYVAAGRGAPAPGVDARDYQATAQRRMQADLEKAKNVMAQGELYARQGKQKLAKQSLESAINYSHGQTDLNEDARVQYHNLIQQQAVAGLMDRCHAVRQAQNIQAEQAPPPAQPRRPAGAPAGLSSRENDSLRVVSEKMLRQQEAAAGVDQGIRVTIPEGGCTLEFRRSLQVDPNTPMRVSFRVCPGSGARHVLTAAAFLGLLAAFYAGIRRCGARPEKRAPAAQAPD